MDALTSPRGCYATGPDGRLPAACPRCGAVLEHFRHDGTPPAPPELTGVPELTPVAPVPPPADPLPPDHPLRLTVCVLCYGEYAQLHRRCLDSILATVPADRLDLRVACNQVVSSTETYLQGLPLTQLNVDRHDRRKYPAMRALFCDPECPITTEWTAWFDDDSYVRDPGWFAALAARLASLPPDPPVGLLGQKMFHALRQAPGEDPREWFRQAPWHRGRPFRDRFGQPAPNGRCIHFVSGGFWVARTRALRDCDLPDPRLNHNGGDITLGEQIYQGGYALASFNDNKALVHTSAHPRRGYHEAFPWYAR